MSDSQKRSILMPLGCLGLFALVCLLAVALVFSISKGMSSAFSAIPASMPLKKEVVADEILLQNGDSKKIAQIDIEGVIVSSAGRGLSMVDEIKGLLDHAVNDEEVAAIVVRVNSPGGEVTASDVLYNAVKNAAAKKPVVIYMDSVAASGGYYLACGGDHIIANPTTLTGSIGVIIQTINYKEMINKVGVSVMTFKSGQFKDMLSGSRDITPAESAYVADLVMESYERFLGIVSEARDIPVEQLRGTPNVDGRIYSGKTAVDNNMIDATGYIEDAWIEARKRGNASDAKVVRYRMRHSFADLLAFFGQANAGQADGTQVTLDVSDRLIPRIQSGTPYYLYLPTGDSD